MVIVSIIAMIGLLLVYLEFFLPGGIMAVCGGALLLISLIFFLLKNPGSILLASFIVSVGILLYLVVKLALYNVRKTKKDQTIYSDDHQGGYIASKFSEELLGKNGIAASDLKPSGYILVEEKYIQASSSGKYIYKGKKIKIIKGQGSTLIVKEIGELPCQ
jgi:membrane-bound ClpP family serine protease